MLTRRVPRLIATGFLMVAATSGLVACRTAPNVAAYVGDERVTVGELDTAVDERLEDADIAAFADGQGDGYTRVVLGVLVDREVYDAAARRYDVEVSDEDVRDRIAELLDGRDAEEQYSQAAQQGLARADVFENVREMLLRQEIAAAAGQAGALDEAALRTRYEDTKDQLGAVAMGFVTVPDQATADATLARLIASPADYPAVAAQFSGPTTLPEVQARTPDEIPEVLAAQVAAAAPNTGFTTPVPEVGGVVVTFVQGEPTFEQLRDRLEQQARAEVDQAGAALVEEVRDDLRIHYNPRYGVVKDGALVPATGMVDFLGDDSPAG